MGKKATQYVQELGNAALSQKLKENLIENEQKVHQLEVLLPKIHD